MLTATRHLATFGVSIEAARAWIMDRLDQPTTIFQVAQAFGITHAMLAEIAGGGVTAGQVVGFFTAHGIDSKLLDDTGGPVPGGLEVIGEWLALDESEASVEAFRQAVQARTGAVEYWKLFSADRIENAADGWLTPQELGSDRLGTIDASAKTLEALFYGTMREAVRHIDESELEGIRAYLGSFADALKAADAGATADYVALLADALDDIAPARGDDAERALVADAASAAVALVGAGGSADLLLPLLMGSS